MGSSLSKSHLPRNYWSEETGQVTQGDGCHPRTTAVAELDFLDDVGEGQVPR
jgi:hypothetical protein